MADLEVPDSVLPPGSEESRARWAKYIRELAAPVVATELRRLACDPRLDGSAFRVLTSRSHELDGGSDA